MEGQQAVSAIWIVKTDGSPPYRFLAHPEDRSPAWSPDGSHVAFLSTRDRPAGDRDSGPQIWLIRADGGEAWKLTDHKGTIRSFEWSRDGSQIFFVSGDAKSEEEQAAEKAGDARSLSMRGRTARGAAATRISGSSRWPRRKRAITRDKILVADFAPSPDAKKVAYIYRRENSRNGGDGAELAIVDVPSGSVRTLTQNRSPESNVRWSPDGATISFVAPDERAWELTEGYFFVVPAGGGTPKRVFGGQGRIGEYFWAPDGKSVYFAGSKSARGGVYQVDVTTGAARTLATGDYAVSLDSVTVDRKRGAGVVSSPAAPGDVHLVDLGSGATTRVTDANPQLASLERAQMRAITWKSRDGLEIEGLL